MWQKPIKKTIYLLNVDNYAPELTALTYPFIQHYANKIGANIHLITERRFQGWPVTYEKLQIYDLAQTHANDWNIYIDSDTLIHPECIDYTEYMTKDVIVHNGVDMALIRWKYDRFFKRHRNHIGSCNWMSIASDWCVELWRPLEDLTPEEAIANITPTANEKLCNISADHLIDDYTLSRNIAMYGLKVETVTDLLKRAGLGGSGFFWHDYTSTLPDKIHKMKQTIKEWKI